MPIWPANQGKQTLARLCVASEKPMAEPIVCPFAERISCYLLAAHCRNRIVGNPQNVQIARHTGKEGCGVEEAGWTPWLTS